MSRNPFNVRLFSALLMAGSMVVAGCSDSDYDFDKIDATVGIGGDGLEIPTSSTEDIKLKDVLDLEADGSVVEDASSHDYVFRRTGDPINPTLVNVNKITVAKRGGSSIGFKFSVSNASAAAKRGLRRAGATVSADADIYTFTYTGDTPKEVKDLKYAGATTALELRVPLTSISSAVRSLQNVTITMPGYIDYTVGTCSQDYKSNSGNKLVFENVPTDKEFVVRVNVKGLNFRYQGDAANSISMTKDKVTLVGTIHLSAHGNVTGMMTSAPEEIHANFGMDDFTINSATGKFDPDINLTDGLGSTKITGIPDFLQDPNVKVDLYNPQVLLTVGNDMDVEGTITGKLISKKNGSVINTIDNIKIPVAANTVNNICINRTGEANGSYTVVKVPQLSDAIKTIPDEILFEATAKADASRESTIELGHDYHFSPSYSIDAPLAFAEDAEIVYKDTLDGWNDDIDDLELAEGTYLSATATVDNGVPAYLTVDAVPVGVADANGNREKVNGIKIEFPDGKNKVAASTDGVTKVESPLEIKITETAAGSLKKLDGIIFTASGKAKDGDNKVTGITLNAEKHTLKVRDIKIKIVGKVIGDFN